MSPLERLLDELAGEFTDVVFHSTVPANLTAPSVVVAPGDPFLEPGTHGLIVEAWDVLVVFRADSPDRNLETMRRNSLRVRAAAARAGAAWSSTSGPRRAGGEESTVALAVNAIRFRYDPVPLTESESP